MGEKDLILYYLPIENGLDRAPPNLEYNTLMSSIRFTHLLSGQTTLELVQGDLTRETVDAVVNAANAQLAHGGGVAGAIVRAGGETVQQESDAWVRAYGPVTHAEPALTGAGKLPARYVIHAVGPIWGEGEEDAKLAEALRGALRLAEQKGLETVAFPAISTGIFGFPKDRAARIFWKTFAAYFHENKPTPLRLVRVTIIDQATLSVFLEEAQRAFGHA
jgi:putative ATPase